MKNKLVKSGMLAVLLCVSFSTAAMQYQIQSSTFRYDRIPSSAGPVGEEVPIQYSLSGFFEIELGTVTSFSSGIDYQTISLDGTGLVTTAPVDQPFDLSNLTGLFNGIDFSATFCGYSIVIAGGSCFEAGNIESFSGSLSNGVLTLSGNDPIDTNFSYIYEITATAVPLPAGAVLYLSCLVSSVLLRQIKKS